MEIFSKIFFQFVGLIKGENNMYQLKYFSYVVCSAIGGIIFSKLIPGTDIFTCATWLMAGNALYEILSWKYNDEEN